MEDNEIISKVNNAIDNPPSQLDRNTEIIRNKKDRAMMENIENAQNELEKRARPQEEIEFVNKTINQELEKRGLEPRSQEPKPPTTPPKQKEG